MADYRQQQELDEQEQWESKMGAHVYKAIAAVTADLASEGISKDRKNTQQNYQFRGIDDVYNALSPSLAKHGLSMLPRVLSRECTERPSARGGVLFYVVVAVEFDLVSAEDGSKHTIKTYGEAMDSGDKATNKAMSAAYKYAAMQAFCIPTEGDNDADATTHEVKHGLTQHQQDTLYKLLTETDTNEATFCNWLTSNQAEAVEHLPPTVYARAYAALKKKAQAMESPK